jgi:hypothetical protein
VHGEHVCTPTIFKAGAAEKLTVAALLVAAGGVVIQIVAGHPYPPVPPVFFILLIPAALMAFGRWWWTPLPAILAGLFLTVGLFASGETTRLFNPRNLGDSVGLWIQTLAVLGATVSAMTSTIQNYPGRTSLSAIQKG